MIVHSLFNVLSDVVQGVWNAYFGLDVFILNYSSSHVRSMVSVSDLSIQGVDVVWVDV